MMNAATSAKPSGSSRKRRVPSHPDPESAAAAGLSTATPSARSRAARSNAPGRPVEAAPRSAAAAAGTADWAKSRPALGRGWRPR